MLAESIQAIATQTLCKKIGGGRVAALEILLGTVAVRNLIRENKIHQIPGMIQTSKGVGMETLEGALMKLVLDGKITEQTAIEKSGNRNIMDANNVANQ